jgi:hypothetical protein
VNVLIKKQACEFALFNKCVAIGLLSGYFPMRMLYAAGI